MKKTYNVISKNSLKLSVMFFFTLFFLGMSSSASAQLATSRTAAGSAVDADYSITQKAQIGVTDEVALEILDNELRDIREENLRDDLTPQQEAEISARLSFLTKAFILLTDKNMDVRTSLIGGHQEMAMVVSRFQNNIQTLVDADGIAREYVSKMK